MCIETTDEKEEMDFTKPLPVIEDPPELEDPPLLEDPFQKSS